MRLLSFTLQIATLGPASCTFEQIETLFLAGVDVFRLNFSHGAHEEKAKVRGSTEAARSSTVRAVCYSDSDIFLCGSTV